MKTNSLSAASPLDTQRYRPESRPQETPRDNLTERPSTKGKFSKVNKSENTTQADAAEKTSGSQEIQQEQQQEQSFASLVQSVITLATPTEALETKSLEKKTPTLQLETQTLTSTKASPKEGSHDGESNLRDDSSSSSQLFDTNTLATLTDTSADNSLILSPETPPTQQGSKTGASSAPQVAPATTSELDLTATEQARQNWAPLLIKRAASSVEATIDTPVGQVQVTGKIIGGEAAVVVTVPVALRPQLSQDSQMSEFQDGSYRWDWQQERENPRRDNTEEE